MIDWNTAVIILCLLLLFYLLWMEVKRQPKAWLPARVVATLAAVAGLAGLALPVFYNKKIQANNTPEAILLTEGYHPDSLKKFLNKNGTVTVFSLVKQPAFPQAIYLPDAAFLQNDSSRYRQVHLFGNGLNEDELSTMQAVPFSFHPTATQSGITAVSWNQQLVSGDKLVVQGQYVNNNDASIKIVLNGLGVNLDSCVLPANRSSVFRLQTEPKHLDRAVYSLLVIAGKDTLEKEPLPVEVTVSKPAKVLLLAAFPDFENKFLKNWLAQNGYPVVARTRISKEKFTKEYNNLPGAAMGGITTSWLSQFDVIVADAAELSAIAGSEGAAIQTAVSQQGIGLIVKMDSIAGGNNFYGRNFPLVQDRNIAVKTIRLHFSDDTVGTLNVAQPFYIRPVPGTQPLVQAEKGQVVADSRLLGTGKIIGTTLNNTYTWQLAGREKQYGVLWATLLRQSLKKTELPEAFSMASRLPVINEKLTLQLQTSFAEPPQVLAASSFVAMEQNEQIPFLWQGTYWPPTEGWMPVSTGHSTNAWIYIYGKEDWRTVRAEWKKNLTQQRATALHSSATIDSQPEEKRMEIPKVYFFLLFLFAASFLWFERKYHNG